MPVQLEFGDPERGDEVIIPVEPEALPEDDRGAYPEDTCEADTWKRFDEYPQKMARATAHLDAIPSDWKPPVPLHEKVAAAKKKMGRARPQMVPEEQPDDDEDFEDDQYGLARQQLLNHLLQLIDGQLGLHSFQRRLDSRPELGDCLVAGPGPGVQVQGIVWYQFRVGQT